MRILQEAEAGVPVVELVRKYGFSQSAFYRWRAKHGGIEVAVSLPSQRVIGLLEALILWHGQPECLRTDNGPEFTSKAIAIWAESCGICLLRIQPGKPAQNAYIERFNRSYREAVLGAYIFHSLAEVRQVTTDWLRTYNTIRPHEALGVCRLRSLLTNMAGVSHREWYSKWGVANRIPEHAAVLDIADTNNKFSSLIPSMYEHIFGLEFPMSV